MSTSNRNSRSSVDNWFSSLSFQVVLVPSALSLIGLAVGDGLGRPWLATIFTLAVALVAGGVFWLSWVRNRAELRKLEVVQRPTFAAAEQFGAVVTAVSSSQRNDPGAYGSNNSAKWSTTLTGRLQSLVIPSRMALIHTEASEANTQNVEQWLESLSVASKRFPVEPGRETDVFHLTKVADEAALWASDVADGDVLIDVTGGTAVFSIALFEAANQLGCAVTYIETASGDEHPALRLIYEVG